MKKDIKKAIVTKAKIKKKVTKTSEQKVLENILKEVKELRKLVDNIYQGRKAY